METLQRPLPRPSRILSLGPTIPHQLTLPLGAEPPLRFAIKRHRAARLHTDFRFELFGTLFSLASDDLPSFDPRHVLRLREMPDHDPAYMGSERRIPDGYGAGPMVVWDFGTYAPAFAYEGSAAKAVLESLMAGRLDFEMEGMRLKGRFRLEAASAEWRLFKRRDAYASSSAEPWDERSIVTGRSLDDVEREFRERGW